MVHCGTDLPRYGATAFSSRAAGEHACDELLANQRAASRASSAEWKPLKSSGAANSVGGLTGGLERPAKTLQHRCQRCNECFLCGDFDLRCVRRKGKKRRRHTQNNS